jgi:peptidoglycan-N-acetylmuramic acid deacetylase
MKKTTLIQCPLAFCLAVAFGVSALTAAAKTPSDSYVRSRIKDYAAQDARALESDKLAAAGKYEQAIQILKEEILDVLKSHHVPAAFFLVGTYIRDNPDLVKRMAEEGHIVGNHSMNHRDMSAVTDVAVFEKELAEVEISYQSAIDDAADADNGASPDKGKSGEKKVKMPRYYRPPEGKFSPNNLEMAKKLGYKTIFWSLAYVDWNNDQQPTKEQAFSKLIPRIHNGAVVLLHSTSTTNAQILDELLTKWKDMGYTFGTLDQLFTQQ